MRLGLTVLASAVVLFPLGALIPPSLVGLQPESQANDARKVESTLRRWYDASEAHDSAAYANLLLPSFFIFEDTTRYGKSELTRLVVESFAQGVDRAVLSELNTQVSGDVAWTSFRNAEVFTPKGQSPLPARHYLETAIFRKVGGQWLLERYHATRINRPPPR